MASATTQREIKFLAVGRRQDKVILCSRVHSQDKSYDGVAGTAAKTRVLIESTDGKREWGTVGVSENIIEASLEALVDSMEYALLKK